MDNKTIKKRIQDIIIDIPSLPAVASRVLQIIAHDNSSLEELKRVVILDQSFSSRLLRIANSPYYRRGKSIDDVTDSFIRIGFTTIKALVFAASIKDLCRVSDETDRMLWEHNMAVSVGSMVIANDTGLAPSGEPMIHGLLHDIGKVVLNLTMKDKYAEVMRLAGDENITIIEAERSILGFDHCDVGQCVAEHWNLPESLAYVIANHHRDDLLDKVKDTGLKKTVLLVKCADVICMELGLGFTDSETLTSEEWKYLKLSVAKKRESIRSKIEEEYPKYKDFVIGNNHS
jgi:HD-like signal output (HDOD) protein